MASEVPENKSDTGYNVTYVALLMLVGNCFAVLLTIVYGAVALLFPVLPKVTPITYIVIATLFCLVIEYLFDVERKKKDGSRSNKDDTN